MKIATTDIEGLLLLEPLRFHDERGFFQEFYNQRAFDEAVGQTVRFVQDNHSRSFHGVVRGLHYQVAPHAQGRLIRVVQGRVFDVAVDIRPGSPSFGRWHGIELGGNATTMVWLPPGLAHGFLVLSESADFIYKTTRFHRPDAERCIRWNDPTLAIDWPVAGVEPRLSARDAAAPLLREALAER